MSHPSPPRCRVNPRLGDRRHRRPHPRRARRGQQRRRGCGPASRRCSEYPFATPDGACRSIAAAEPRIDLLLEGNARARTAPSSPARSPGGCPRASLAGLPPGPPPPPCSPCRGGPSRLRQARGRRAPRPRPRLRCGARASRQRSGSPATATPAPSRPSSRPPASSPTSPTPCWSPARRQLAARRLPCCGWRTSAAAPPARVRGGFILRRPAASSSPTPTCADACASRPRRRARRPHGPRGATSRTGRDRHLRRGHAATRDRRRRPRLRACPTSRSTPTATDINGERYRSEEWGFVRHAAHAGGVRRPCNIEASRRSHGAIVGAAFVPLGAIARGAVVPPRLRPRPAPRSRAGSDAGLRGALLLQRPTWRRAAKVATMSSIPVNRAQDPGHDRQPTASPRPPCPTCKMPQDRLRPFVPTPLPNIGKIEQLAESLLEERDLRRLARSPSRARTFSSIGRHRQQGHRRRHLFSANVTAPPSFVGPAAGRRGRGQERAARSATRCSTTAARAAAPNAATLLGLGSTPASWRSSATSAAPCAARPTATRRGSKKTADTKADASTFQAAARTARAKKKKVPGVMLGVVRCPDGQEVYAANSSRQNADLQAGSRADGTLHRPGDG